MQMNVHGTYPYDMYGKWEPERWLSHDEAAELVGAPEEVRKESYMWVNKGFIVLGLPQDKGRPLILEDVFFTVELKGIKKGMRAVYLHDGKYTLLRRVED
jgi:hypothetical protein